MRVYFAINGKGSAERILQFELYPPLCIYNVEFHQQREHSWVVSECLYLLCKCSLILLSPFALGQLEEIAPLMGMLFMCFFTMFRVWGSGFQAGGCLPVFFGLQALQDELLIIIFIITSIFCISYMEPLLAISKIMGLPGNNAVNNFVWEGLVNVVVSHWPLESNSGLFSNSWKLILNTSKNLKDFVLGRPCLLSSHSDSATFTRQNDSQLFRSILFWIWLWPLQYCCIQQRTNNFVSGVASPEFWWEAKCLILGK